LTHTRPLDLPSLFASRDELNKTGVHLPTRAGISGAAEEGADSIVLSGGYEDDRDDGDVIIYTGHGAVNRIRASRLLIRSSNVAIKL
jgi:putative restriction endonuclease